MFDYYYVDVLLNRIKESMNPPSYTHQPQWDSSQSGIVHRDSSLSETVHPMGQF